MAAEQPLSHAQSGIRSELVAMPARGNSSGAVIGWRLESGGVHGGRSVLVASGGLVVAVRGRLGLDLSGGATMSTVAAGSHADEEEEGGEYASVPYLARQNVRICVRENRGTLQTLGDRTQGIEHVDLLSYLKGKHRARQSDTVFFTQVRTLVRR